MDEGHKLSHAAAPVAELLRDMRHRGIEITLAGDGLRCAFPRGELGAESQAILRQRKAEIVAFLRAGQATLAWPEAIVPLHRPHEQRSGIPVYAVPGHSGAVFAYRALAAHVRTHPFFALQPPGVDDDAQPLTSVAGLASYFAGQIRSVEGRGPVVVAGFCAGGTIAFELARQLAGVGIEVLFAAMIGSPHPSFFLARRRAGAQLAAHARQVMRLSPRDALGYAKERLRDRRRWHEDPILVRRINVERATLAAVRDYMPERFAGRLCLLLPSDPWASSPAGHELWRALADTCDVCRPAGECLADNMLDAEHAPAVAALLEAAFRQKSVSEIPLGSW